MKRLFGIWFCFFLAPLCFGNDGGYSGGGDTLHPINITEVSLDYERLSFYRKNDIWEIEVYIELNNQTNQTLTPLLGFEFSGDNGGPIPSLSSRTSFTHYVLTVNGEAQKYRQTREGERDINEALLYTPRLTPGINKVYHYYTLKEGYGSLNGYLEYILTTGGRWKDGVIKELEIFIRTDTPGVVKPISQEKLLRANTGSLMDFDLIGQSKIYDGYFSRDNMGRFYSLSDKGYLYKRLTNYRPLNDIRFWFFNYLDRGYMNVPPLPGEFIGGWWKGDGFQPYKYIRYWHLASETDRYRWTENGDDKVDEKTYYENFSEGISTMSKDELRILRNTIYAIDGYVFNDTALQAFFDTQYWYFPNPNVRQEDVKMNEKMFRILQTIQNAEKNN